MNLEALRELQRVLQQTMFDEELYDILEGRSFAYGVGLTDTPGRYRLAVRMPDERALDACYEGYARNIGGTDDVLDMRVSDPYSIPPRDSPLLPQAGPLGIGRLVHHAKGPDGTIGFFARRKNVKGIVSCSHVLGFDDTVALGDAVHGPARTKIGTLQHFSKLELGCAIARADCAFVAVDEEHWPENPGALVNGRTLQTTPATLNVRTPVFKLGISTQCTTGVAQAILSLVEVRYEPGLKLFHTAFHSTVEIETDKVGSTFADKGDSGALVVTQNGNQPVGLLFAESVSNDRNKELHYANSIASVLRCVRAEIVT